MKSDIIKKVLLILVWTVSTIVLIMLISCEKEKPNFKVADCIKCTKLNSPNIDTCGSTQNMFTYSLELKKQGYICKSFNDKKHGIY